MTLRFEVNQAEAFRRGIDVPKSTVYLEVDPSTLPQDERNLIADRLEGIDVIRFEVSCGDVQRAFAESMAARRIVAALPTYEALLEAIRKNEDEVKVARRLNERAANCKEDFSALG
jgi:hypothetical protein